MMIAKRMTQIALLALMFTVALPLAHAGSPTATVCGKVVALKFDGQCHLATISPVNGGATQSCILYGDQGGPSQSMLLGVAYLNKEYVKMGYDPSYLTACGSNNPANNVPANYAVTLTNSTDPASCN